MRATRSNTGMRGPRHSSCPDIQKALSDGESLQSTSGDSYETDYDDGARIDTESARHGSDTTGTENVGSHIDIVDSLHEKFEKLNVENHGYHMAAALDKNPMSDDPFVTPIKIQDKYAPTQQPFGYQQAPYAAEYDDLVQPDYQSNTRSVPSAIRNAGAIDPQSFYSPKACVFVANLPDNFKDEALEEVVTKAFTIYGTVFVKIRRDGRKMPMAFCQFTNEHDAASAIANGQTTEIGGRICRVELVRANKKYVIYHKHGISMTTEDAGKAIQIAKLGAVKDITVLPFNMQEHLGLHSGACIVEFAQFDPAFNAHTAFRRHPEYQVVAYDEKKIIKGLQDEAEAQFQADRDNRSIFIGNLPPNRVTLEYDLKIIAGKFGHVVDIQVVRKFVDAWGAENVFAFIEFEDTSMVEEAVGALQGKRILGRRSRVQRKTTKPSRKGQQAIATTPIGSPNRGFGHDFFNAAHAGSTSGAGGFGPYPPAGAYGQQNLAPFGTPPAHGHAAGMITGAPPAMPSPYGMMPFQCAASTGRQYVMSSPFDHGGLPTIPETPTRGNGRRGADHQRSRSRLGTELRR